MAMRVHELHPSVVHLPIALLPAAAGVELLAATAQNRLKREAYDRVGRKLWWATTASAALAGFAGFAAAHETKPERKDTQDAMFAHGLGNTVLLLAATGVTIWRSGHRAGPFTAALGMGAVAGALYTAWLGGELVYGHGLGVKPLERDSGPALLSGEGARRLGTSGAGGFRWLMARAKAAITGRSPIDTGAISPTSDRASDPHIEVRPSVH
jgi:uncharacterized membrane protein